MGSEPEQWAKDWLAEQRRQGKTGLTVERRGGIHIVRWATTWWDSANKKRHKESLYCGVLSEDGTIVEKRIDHERRTRYCAYVVDTMESLGVWIQDDPAMWRFLKAHPGIDQEFRHVHRMAQDELPGCTERIVLVTDSGECYVRYSIRTGPVMDADAIWKVVEINRKACGGSDLVVNSI